LNGQSATTAFDLFASLPPIAIPANVQTLIEQSFAKAQSSYAAASAQTQKNARALEEVLSTSQKEARAIGDKVLRDVEANADAFFKAANALARAKTLPEIVSLQTDFVSQQLKACETQGKELFELSTKLVQQTFDSLNSVVATSFRQFKL
jgi:hypothetical protein